MGEASRIIFGQGFRRDFFTSFHVCFLAPFKELGPSLLLMFWEPFEQSNLVAFNDPRLL